MTEGQPIGHGQPQHTKTPGAQGPQGATLRKAVQEPGRRAGAKGPCFSTRVIERSIPCVLPPLPSLPFPRIDCSPILLPFPNKYKLRSPPATSPAKANLSPTNRPKTNQRVLGFDPIGQFYTRVQRLYGQHLALPPFLSPLHQDALALTFRPRAFLPGPFTVLQVRGKKPKTVGGVCVYGGKKREGCDALHVRDQPPVGGSLSFPSSP